MRIIRHCDQTILKARPVITIGNFDGVHKGHQALIRETINFAKKYDTISVVFTFEPHPAVILSGKKNVRIISLREKILKLKALGVDILYIIKFTKKFAAMSAHEFLENILIKKFNPSHIIVGYDFVFGKNREGDGKLIEKYAKINDINVTKLPPLRYFKDIIISSSLVRKLIMEGKINKACRLLGDAYFITGKIIDNNFISEVLNLPVIYVTLNDLICPKAGIYRANIKINDDCTEYKAITHIIPSKNQQITGLLEIHIINYKYNLHNKRIRINLEEMVNAKI